MQVKRYEANNLQEAIARIKKDLGPDAIILSTGKIPGRPNLIEVLAARDEYPAPTIVPENPSRGSEAPPPDAFSRLVKDIHELKKGVEMLNQGFPRRRDLSDLKDAMNLLMDTASVGYPPHLRTVYMRMVSAGISSLRSAALVDELKKSFAGNETDSCEQMVARAEKLIARSLMKTDPTERRIKAFIGPTGVGKTTTLAKLAAHYNLEKKMKVGMITTDTYRIAATEQLKVYANIMGLPLKVASDKESFLSSLTDFADKDMILVDTPGRNHNDDQGLNKLKKVLRSDVETVLLLSPATCREHLLDTANRFGIFGYNRLILTKVDECNHLGFMYDVLDEIGKPVSHLTTGQNVPRDIEKASPERVAKLILQNSLN
jgi:flagellar biosynthesis protein FlhF